MAHHGGHCIIEDRSQVIPNGQAVQQFRDASDLESYQETEQVEEMMVEDGIRGNRQ